MRLTRHISTSVLSLTQGKKAIARTARVRKFEGVPAVTARAGLLPLPLPFTEKDGSNFVQKKRKKTGQLMGAPRLLPFPTR